MIKEAEIEMQSRNVKMMAPPGYQSIPGLMLDNNRRLNDVRGSIKGQAQM